MATGLTVGILGECVPVDPGTGVPTSVSLSPAARRILARLAMDAGRAVAVDELCVAVWGADWPRSARASLHNQVSRLRVALGVEVLATSGEGYRLDADTDAQVAIEDAVRAERASAAGTWEEADRHAERVLRWWRGPPLADLDGSPDVVAVRIRLDEVRRAAENVRLSARIELGHVGWAVSEAERLVAATPLDEQRWTMLVTALDRAGRRGDALGAVQRARDQLRDQLGLEPGPALRAIEARILQAPEDPERPRLPLIGRSRLVDELVNAVAAGDRLVLHGEEGSGRSAVLDECVRRLRDQRVRVAATRCEPHPATPLAALRSLLVELRVEPDPVLAPVGAFYAGLRACPGPVALVVDDLDLAGPSTVSALAAVAELPHVGLLASGHGETTATLSATARSVRLPPLDEAAVAEMARALLDESAPDVDPAWLLEQSGGNPLFLAALLADGPAHVPGRSSGADRSVHLRTLVRSQLAALTPEVRACLEVVAACGPEAPSALLGRLTIEGALESAEREGLVVTGPGGGVRFTHGVVGRTVYDDLPPGRRAELHHATGLALLAAEAEPVLVAHHLVRTGDLDPPLALHAVTRAAERASALGAHQEAAAWYRRAAELTGTTAAQHVRARIGYGDALRLSGDPQHEDVLFDVTEQALRLGDMELTGEAAFAMLQLGATTPSGAPHPRAVALKQRVLTQVTDPDLRALVAGAASLAHSMSGDGERCRELFFAAERQARSEEVRRRVLPFAYMGVGHPDDLPTRAALSEELVELAEAAGDPVALFEGLHLVFSVGLQQADGDRVRSSLRQMEGLVERVGDVGRRWALRYQAAAVAHLDDDLDHSRQLSTEACELFEPVSPTRALAVYGAQLLALHVADGTLGSLAPLFRTLVVEQPGVPAWHSAYALSVARHEPYIAREQLAAALDAAPNDFTWLAHQVIAARAAVVLGDAEMLEAYRLRLLPYSGLVCWAGTCAYGPVDTVLALIARAGSDVKAARRFAGRARKQARRLGGAVFLRELDESGLAQAG